MLTLKRKLTPLKDVKCNTSLLPREDIHALAYEKTGQWVVNSSSLSSWGRVGWLASVLALVLCSLMAISYSQRSAEFANITMQGVEGEQATPTLNNSIATAER